MRTTSGRPRTFDEEEVLDRSIELFWTAGYRNTTTRDLEAKLGISQSSIYNAFGSKRDILLRAIDRYELRVEKDLLSILDGPLDGVEAVDSFIVALGKWIEDNMNRGCLVVNLMVGEVDDPVIVRRAQDYRAKIRRRLYSALAREPGISRSEAARQTELVLSSVLGLHITARSGGRSPEVAGMVEGLRHQLAAWTV